MNETVKEILSKLTDSKDGGDRVFRYKNKDSVGRAFRRVLTALNINRPHDLRHTFITDLVTKGFDLKTIMEISGHKDIRMLIERYTHPGLDHKLDTVRSLDNLKPTDNIVSIDKLRN